ncbi:hypothetical protein [Mesoflavibacter sp. SCSIO 43206]|uniref:hypothetical protein n=1 Tax=Mesoflavibacter sp. SCSIO 43206 TaxID=2779362 RepID=UPI001CAA012C|nr:hypothetical protein [Mesoflavibacter sp. SCSIO 43206]UAB74304.1 hypothetical protein INR78_07815 [Mesoflavibacter sp. SCSIO 43206]
MVARDVYKIALALSKKELKQFYKLLAQHPDIEPLIIKPKSKIKASKLPDFSLEDSIRYLLTNHFNKK